MRVESPEWLIGVSHITFGQPNEEIRQALGADPVEREQDTSAVWAFVHKDDFLRPLEPSEMVEFGNLIIALGKQGMQ
jgi:hypothetical protein